MKSLTNSATSQAAKARSILEKAGYTLKGGFFYKGSKEVSLTIIDPSSYTDYADDDALAAQELRAAGINATFQGLTVSSWNQDVASGDFQLMMHWSNGGLTPYNEFDGWLDSSLATGNNATGDYERLNSPTLNADLAKLAAAPDAGRANGRPRPAGRVHGQPAADHPDDHGFGVVRVQLAAFRRMADAVQPVRDRSTFGHQQRPGTGTDEVVALHLSPR